MSYTYVTHLDHAEITRFLYTRSGPIMRAVDDWGQQVRVVARRRAPHRTGKLIASLFVNTDARPGFIFTDIGTLLRYGYWQHQGTGVYGGRGPIVATRGRAMRFVPSMPIGPLRPTGHFFSGAQRHPGEVGLFVYARSVQGIPPLPYLTSALADVTGQRVGVRGSLTRIRAFQGRAQRRTR